METEAPMKSRAILTKAADWARQNKYCLCVLAVLLLAALLAFWALDAHRSVQLSELRAEYAATAEKLRAAEAETAAARKELAEKRRSSRRSRRQTTAAYRR